MKKVSLTLALTVILLQPTFVSAEETCVDITAPVTSVADFNADGIVNRKDIRILTRHIRDLRIKKRVERLKRRGSERVNSRYYRKYLNRNIAFNPMLDRNADGKINFRDVRMTVRDMRKHSTEEDQKLAEVNNEILAGTYSCIASPAVEEVIPEEPTSSDPANVDPTPAPTEIIMHI